MTDMVIHDAVGIRSLRYGRYRYRYTAEVPNKAKPRRQLRQRGTKKAAMDDLQHALFTWLAARQAAQRNPDGWVRFAFLLARSASATDPDGDHWQIRRVWEQA